MRKGLESYLLERIGGIMLKLAVVICVVLWPGLAEAITWDFDDGTPQGVVR